MDEPEQREEPGDDFENVIKISLVNGTKSIEIGVWSEGNKQCKELFDHAIKKAEELNWMKNR